MIANDHYFAAFEGVLSSDLWLPRDVSGGLKRFSKRRKVSATV